MTAPLWARPWEFLHMAHGNARTPPQLCMEPWPGPGSSPRWTDFCRFCCIAPGTRTSARRSVPRVIHVYYHYDEYLARMRRDIAPVHDIATFCTLQEPQITTDDPETTRGHALQTCCTRHSFPPPCTATALHAPRPHALPTSQPVQRQAHNDRS